MLINVLIFFEVVMFFILFVGIIGNFIVCFFIILNKKLRILFNYFFFNLVVFDLCCFVMGILFFVG